MQGHYPAHRGEIEAVVTPVLPIKVQLECLTRSKKLCQIRILPWSVCFQNGGSVVLWRINGSSIVVHSLRMLIPIVWVVIALVCLGHCVRLSGVRSRVLLVHVPLGSSSILVRSRPRRCTVLPVCQGISLCVVPGSRLRWGQNLLVPCWCCPWLVLCI